MYTDLLKNQITSSLLKDGFKIIDKKSFMIATKKEKILYIRGLEEVHSELNFKYLAQDMQVKNVGGVEVKELKKLIIESGSKQTPEIMTYISNKLNWGMKFSDSFEIDEKEIEFIELVTDRGETITLVFFDYYDRARFIALEMPNSDFLKIIDKLRYQTLEVVAPSLYKLMTEAP